LTKEVKKEKDATNRSGRHLMEKPIKLK